MQIDVVISEWEQACCGIPFRVGDRMTWKILAADPQSTRPGASVRFDEEHHGQTPLDIPHWDVTGVVTSITCVRYPRVAIPGQARTFTWDITRPDSHPVEAVDKSGAIEADQYVIGLSVADDENLPTYRPSAESIIQSERETLTARRNRARARDDIGEALESLADEAQGRFGDVARVSRTEGRSAVTIEPHRDGATIVHWARSDDAEADGISVHVGDGDWHFEASIANAEVVRLFLDAAASGRVEEHVEFRNSRPHALRTDVHALDGRMWTTTDTIGVHDAGGGVRLIAGYFHKRIQRGDHVYPPWTSRT
jgi:hypothetical protein